MPNLTTMSALQAARMILEQAGTPLHYEEITKRILASGLWHTNGKTPDETVNARLAVDIETTNLMSQIHFYSPSVLGFGSSTNGPSATNLWVSVPGSFNPNGYEVAWAFFPAVWHDGKWKCCFGDVGWIP